MRDLNSGLSDSKAFTFETLPYHFLKRKKLLEIKSALAILEFKVFQAIESKIHCCLDD